MIRTQESDRERERDTLFTLDITSNVKSLLATQLLLRIYQTECTHIYKCLFKQLQDILGETVTPVGH